MDQRLCISFHRLLIFLYFVKSQIQLASIELLIKRKKKNSSMFFMYGLFHSSYYIDKTTIYFGLITGQVSMEIYFPSNRCNKSCKTQWFYLSVYYIFTVNVLCYGTSFSLHFILVGFYPLFKNNENQKFLALLLPWQRRKSMHFHTCHFSKILNI